MRIWRMSAVVILLTTISVSTIYAQNGPVLSLSLQEAISFADSASYDNRVAAGQLRHAKGQRLEAWSGFLPRVTISENFIRSNDPVTVFSLKLKQGIFSQDDFALEALNTPDPISNFTTSFQLQQPLFNLDAIHASAATKSVVKAREQGLDRAKQAIKLQVKKAYYGLTLAYSQLDALDLAVEAAGAHLEDARASFEQGIIHEADYLSAEVRLSELQEQQITAEHGIDNASDMLKFIIGLRNDARILPTDSLSLQMLAEAQTIPDTLTPPRSDLQALRFQSEAASRMAAASKSGWIPSLNAFGGVELNAANAFASDGSSWAVGLQLSWDVFDGLATPGQTQQASADAEVAEIRLRQAEEQASLEVRKASRAVQSATKRLSVARRAVEQAAESHRITGERFKQGLARTSDALDKETALTNARLRLLKAQYDYRIATSELAFALGEE